MQTPQTTTTTQQDWREVSQGVPTQRLVSRKHYHEAGVPVWGALLVAIGLIALLGNFGLNLGWLFGLALGTWFIYLGVRHTATGEPVNWWIVGLGLLIGLGSISTGFTDQLIFPVVLIIVGLGILGERTLNRPGQSQFGAQ
jgi:hypothetical protein